MLKDRRALLEHELKIARDLAAQQYLEIVLSSEDADLESYQILKDRVSSLQFDLDIVTKLINQGND